MLLGSVDEMLVQLQAQRLRWGPSYYVTQEAYADALGLAVALSHRNLSELERGDATVKRKAKAKTRRAAKSHPPRKAAKGGNVSTYTVTTHVRRIHSKLG